MATPLNGNSLPRQVYPNIHKHSLTSFPHHITNLRRERSSDCNAFYRFRPRQNAGHFFIAASILTVIPQRIPASTHHIHAPFTVAACPRAAASAHIQRLPRRTFASKAVVYRYRCVCSWCLHKCICEASLTGPRSATRPPTSLATAPSAHHRIPALIGCTYTIKPPRIAGSIHIHRNSGRHQYDQESGQQSTSSKCGHKQVPQHIQLPLSVTRQIHQRSRTTRRYMGVWRWCQESRRPVVSSAEAGASSSKGKSASFQLCDGQRWQGRYSQLRQTQDEHHPRSGPGPSSSTSQQPSTASSSRPQSTTDQDLAKRYEHRYFALDPQRTAAASAHLLFFALIIPSMRPPSSHPVPRPPLAGTSSAGVAQGHTVSALYAKKRRSSSPVKAHSTLPCPRTSTRRSAQRGPSGT